MPAVVSETAPTSTETWKPPPGFRAILFALLLAQLLAALDQTIVSTALPTITGELGGLEHLSWVVTAYLLASTAAAPLWGKAADLFGHKRMLQTAVAVFLVGSLLAGMSTSMEWLIITRAVQGLGGGGLLILVVTTIGDLVPLRARGKYAGLMGSAFGVASVLGPLLGGLFTEHLSWRWVFYINMPLGVAAFIVLALKLHPHEVEHERGRMDLPGAALLVPSVISLLLALQWGGRQYPWASVQILGLFAAAAVLAGLFVWRELTAPDPLVPLRLWRDRLIASASLISFITGFAMFGSMVYLSLHMQVVRGLSPTLAGLGLIPMTIGIMSTSITSGKMISRTGQYKAWPIIGSLLLGGALVSAAQLDGSQSYWVDAVVVLVLGAGLGCLMKTLILVVQSSVGREFLGAATSGVTFIRSIGASIGTAVFGVVFNNQLLASARAVPVEGMSLEALNSLPAAGHDAVVGTFADAISGTFYFAVPFTVLALALAVLMPKRQLHTPQDAPGPALAE